MRLRQATILLATFAGAFALTAPPAFAGSAGSPDVSDRPGSKQASIARLVTPVTVRSGPGNDRGNVTRLKARARWNGGPVGLLVLGSRVNRGVTWLLVRLPGRPNGSRGWIPADRALVSRTPWRIEVDLSERRVELFKSGEQVASFRSVVGAPGTPTPTGLFAISERAYQPDPDQFLGRWALLLTAYSKDLRRYDGGPGQIAIHGRGGSSFLDPLGSARSHGCVRINNRPVSMLARVAREGTPVRISR